MDSKITIDKLRQKIRKMYLPRGWFNNAKDASISLAIEASELLAHFQFGDGDKSTEKVIVNKKKKEEVASEIADITIWLCEICDKLGIDISEAITKKIKFIDKKYPVEKNLSHESEYYWKQKMKYRK